MVVQTAQDLAPQPGSPRSAGFALRGVVDGRQSVAQHAALGGVLGKVGKRHESRSCLCHRSSRKILVEQEPGFHPEQAAQQRYLR